MFVDGKRYTGAKQKADQFVNHYAKVSTLEFSQEEEESVNKRIKEALRDPKNKDNAFPHFTPRELSRALNKMKIKGAPGPDDIPPSFLKNLGPKAFMFLLNIFNLSIDQAECPQQWRDAIIVPLLKAGKSASNLDSFRPISLTSCVVKCLERMIAERLYYLAETENWFNEQQAGFRKGMSCEDQILKITQAIDDGFRDVNGLKRSALVLLDFSKAYDTVWRQKLLLTMLEKGVPAYIVQWVNGFLTNRQASVRFNGTLSRSRQFKQGLPQGSVLAPILFLFYINNLADILPSETINALFADDVAILGQDADAKTANSKAQQTVDVVNKWSKEWKLTLNASKSETGFFTLDKSEAEFSPKIIIDGVVLDHNQIPRLLGVLLDRELFFTAHTDKVLEKVKSKSKMIAALANTEYGWDKSILRRIFLVYCRSAMDYAAIAYQGFLLRPDETNPLRLQKNERGLDKPSTNAKKLDTAQNACLRLITGQSKSTPLEALRRESNVPSYYTVMIENCLKGYEKSLHLPISHPRRKIFDQDFTERKGLQRKYNPRSTIKEIATKALPELHAVNEDNALFEPRKPLNFYTCEPWYTTAETAEVYCDLPGISGKKEDASKIRQAAYARITELRGDDSLSPVIYTDGSASKGTSKGGSAAVVTTGSPQEPIPTEIRKRKGANLTCSFGEEEAALELALQWLEDNLPRSAVVVTDSQSLCRSLKCNNPDMEALQKRIQQYPNKLTIQWVPGHCGIAGNELADKAAKDATTEDGPAQPVTFQAVRSKIRELAKDPPVAHDITRQVYHHIDPEREKQIKNRKDQVLLANVRTGHSPLFLKHKSRINPHEDIDTKCPRCLNGDDTMVHWMTQCETSSNRRREFFGPENMVDLGMLTKHPTKALALIKSTLLPDQQ
jgi:ribonuclease HI